MVHSVLFVCLGNICRSPLAQAAFELAAARAGLEVFADSAATRGWHEGKAPDKRSIAVAKAHGVNIAHQRARILLEEDYTRFGHIIAMDRDNLNVISKRAPVDSTARIALILDHVPGREGQDVEDPWHGRVADFERPWAEVSAGAMGLLSLLQGR